MLGSSAAVVEKIDNISYLVLKIPLQFCYRRRIVLIGGGVVGVMLIVMVIPEWLGVSEVDMRCGSRVGVLGVCSLMSITGAQLNRGIYVIVFNVVGKGII